MGTLTVWRFDQATGADAALAKLENLDAQEVIEIEDAAVVGSRAGDRLPLGGFAWRLATRL